MLKLALPVHKMKQHWIVMHKIKMGDSDMEDLSAKPAHLLFTLLYDYELENTDI